MHVLNVVYYNSYNKRISRQETKLICSKIIRLEYIIVFEINDFIINDLKKLKTNKQKNDVFLL
jgi:hypothetical protein